MGPILGSTSITVYIISFREYIVGAAKSGGICRQALVVEAGRRDAHVLRQVLHTCTSACRTDYQGGVRIHSASPSPTSGP